MKLEILNQSPEIIKKIYLLMLKGNSINPTTINEFPDYNNFMFMIQTGQGFIIEINDSSSHTHKFECSGNKPFTIYFNFGNKTQNN